MRVRKNTEKRSRTRKHILQQYAFSRLMNIEIITKENFRSGYLTNCYLSATGQNVRYR